MDIADLRTFEAVARHGSMNRAASELNTVQSNVTSRIRNLEHGMGATLFRRYAKGVALTPAGERMLPYAKHLVRLLHDARTAVTDDGTASGRLAIGSMETAAAVRLSPILSRFAAHHPDVDLSLTTGATEALIADVLDYNLDGAFVAGPVDHPRLVAERCFDEELVLVTPLDMTSLDSLARAECVKTIVFRQGCHYRMRLDRFLGQCGVVRTAALEFGSIEAILACVGAGVGVTMLPRSVLDIAWQREQVMMHALPDAHGRTETLFVRLQDAYVTRALQAFVATTRRSAHPRSEAIAAASAA